MASLLEQMRVDHEEVERLERLVVDRLSQEARSYKERLVQSQTVAYMVEQITHRAAKLVRAPRPHRAAVGSPLHRVVFATAPDSASPGRGTRTRTPTALAKRRLRHWAAGTTCLGAWLGVLCALQALGCDSACPRPVSLPQRLLRPPARRAGRSPALPQRAGALV